MAIIDYMKLRDALNKGVQDLKNAMNNNVGALANPDFGLEAIKKSLDFNTIPPENHFAIDKSYAYNNQDKNNLEDFVLFETKRPFIATTFDLGEIEANAARWRPITSEPVGTEKKGRIKLKIDYGNDYAEVDIKILAPGFGTSSASYMTGRANIALSYHESKGYTSIIRGLDQMSLENFAGTSSNMAVPNLKVNASRVFSTNSGITHSFYLYSAHKNYMAFPHGVKVTLTYETHNANALGFDQTETKFAQVIKIYGAYLD